MDTNLVETWLEHCKISGHITQGEAMSQGKKQNIKKYATFNMSPSGNRIYCGLKGCEWTARNESAQPEAVHN